MRRTAHVPALVLALLATSSCSPRVNPPGHPPAAIQAPPKDDSFARLAADYWEWRRRTSPTWATWIGDRRFDAELPVASVEGIRKQLDEARAFRKRLDALDVAKLSRRERISADVLAHELDSALRDAEACRDWEWQVDQMYGAHLSFAELTTGHEIRDEKDVETLAARYTKMKGWWADHVAGLRVGLAAGRVAPKISVERVLSQLDAMLAKPIAESAYLEDVTFPAAWSDARKEAARAKLAKAIEAGVNPGLASYREFLRNDLLPKARTSVGVSSMPGGAACYAAKIRTHVGVDRTPEEVHRIGLEEVARIESEMKTLMRKARAGEDLKIFHDMLRQRREQYLDTPEKLLEHNRKLVERAQAALPRAFGTLPKTPIEVKAIEEWRAKESPAGYYYDAPDDGTRPAYYYVNVYDPKSRPLWNMTALAHHEAVPGHHLQIALANENDSLPEFQQRLGQSAFVEGWALYAERLADELGLYPTLEEQMGRLNYEMWRAIRLVVDTGMHAKGWSREEALRFFREHALHSEAEIVSEVDRYVTWPGQALAYKLGEIEIRAMRADAEKRLGVRFDLRSFHDRLLSNGAVPLPTAKKDIDEWVALQLREPAPR